MKVGVGSKHRLFQVDFKFIAQIRAAKDLVSAAAAGTPENVAEHFTENVAECAARVESATPAAVKSRVA